MTAALATAGLRTIRVYGTLARLLGRREMRATVSTVPEAMRFLVANFPQVEGHLKGRFFKVKVANWSLTEHDLEAPVGQTETIHIIPAICGAGGDGPLVGILAGAALLGIGLLVPFGGSVLVPLGIGLLLNGVAALLSPTPEVTDEDNDPARSYNFSGIQQNSREGIPVPLVYGDIVTGSIVLSVDIQADDIQLGEGAGVIAGTGGANSPADEADALYVGGSGNPNPDPNPVPDEQTIVVPPGSPYSTWVISASGTVFGNANDYPECNPSWESPANLYIEIVTGRGPGPHRLVLTRAGSFTLGTAYTSTGCAYYTTSTNAGYSVTRPTYEIYDASGNRIAAFSGNYPTSWSGGAHPDSTVWGFITPVLVSYHQ